MKGVLTKKQSEALEMIRDGRERMKNGSSRISKASLKNLRRRGLIACEMSKAGIMYDTATISVDGRDVADSFRMTPKG